MERPGGYGIGGRALCVALHDVAPATWPACAELLAAIRQVADIPLTLLVVPRFHGDGEAGAEAGHAAQPARQEDQRAYEHTLGALAGAGHELALHGYTHLDDGPPARDLRTRFLRGVYTTGEGEFAALDAGQARRRIALGLEWFGQRGWRPAGFVPPAWLLSEGAWQALGDFPFAYTTTWRRFHLLPRGAALHAPALVYAARNRGGRLLSPPLASALALGLRRAPLVRLALHPRDALHPALVRHAQQLIARLLDDGREALSKAAVAQRWSALGHMPAAVLQSEPAPASGAITSTVPNSRRRPSDAARSRHGRTGHSAAAHPSC